MQIFIANFFKLQVNKINSKIKNLDLITKCYIYDKFLLKLNLIVNFKTKIIAIFLLPLEKAFQQATLLAMFRGNFYTDDINVKNTITLKEKKNYEKCRLKDIYSLQKETFNNQYLI